MNWRLGFKEWAKFGYQRVGYMWVPESGLNVGTEIGLNMGTKEWAKYGYQIGTIFKLRSDWFRDQGEMIE